MSDSHNFYMQMALEEARNAFDQQEIPVGAVIVNEGRIIARGYNLTQTLHDVTAHAEMQTLTSAADYMGSKYLSDCILYVTLEPCVMCAGAIGWAQIGTLVYGASDPKKGFTLWEKRIVHPKTKIIRGIMEKECTEILRQFFSDRRSQL